MLTLIESDLNNLTRTDLQNLVSMNDTIEIIRVDGFRLERNSRDVALEQRQKLQDYDDRTVYETITAPDPETPDIEEETQAIENPHPRHKQLEFDRWLDVVEDQARDTKGNERIATKKKEILDSYPPEEVQDAVVVLT